MSEAAQPGPDFMDNKVLKLYHGDELIGTITDLTSDFPSHGGRIQLTDAAKKFAHIWEFFTSEGGRQKDPPFEIPDSVYEDWSIEDENGARFALFDLPAVHANGEVWWNF